MHLSSSSLYGKMPGEIRGLHSDLLQTTKWSMSWHTHVQACMNTVSSSLHPLICILIILGTENTDDCVSKAYCLHCALGVHGSWTLLTLPYSLNARCPLQAHVFAHLVLHWWGCFGIIWTWVLASRHSRGIGVGFENYICNLGSSLRSLLSDWPLRCELTTHIPVVGDHRLKYSYLLLGCFAQVFCLNGEKTTRIVPMVYVCHTLPIRFPTDGYLFIITSSTP